MNRARRYWRLALIGVAGAVVFLLVGPVFGSAHPDADRLRLTATTEAFFYGDTDPAALGVIVQPLTLGSNGCEISPLAGPLVTLSSYASSGGGVKDPGLVKGGLGVKSGGSNGTPCSQTADNEVLVIESANAWYKMVLDLEPKFNGWVHVKMYFDGGEVAHHQLLTGSSIATYNEANDPDETPLVTTVPYMAKTTSADPVEACANPSDSGPDSGPNDNCLWTIEPGVVFDRVEISTSVGAVSLNGGGDFEGFEGFEDGAYDSLFYRALIANPDNYTTNEDIDLVVAAPGVLANDSLPAGSPTVTVVSGPDNGTITVGNDGSFTYDPDLDYNGADSFTYSVVVGGQTATATVSITVNPVNDLPQALGTPLTAVEDTPTTYFASDLATDADGDLLIITVASATGTTTVNEDGTVGYTPPADVCSSGSDTLTFTVDDDNGGVLNSSVAINITCVNDPPAANADEMDDEYEMDERVATGTSTFVVNVLDQAANTGVLANDTDPDGDALTVSAFDANSTEGGTVAANADGSFTFTPSLKADAEWDTLGVFSYDDTWDYTVSDGTLSDTATVTITVHRVVCSDETVSDTDGQVTGAFTLISESAICKRYEVDADGTANTVTFNPQAGGAEGNELFRGFLTFIPQAGLDEDGTFSVGLTYDPDNEGPLLARTLQLCINPAFDIDGLVTSATFPVVDDFQETWCLASESSHAVGDPAVVVTTSQVIGTEDPVFGFK